MTTTTHQDTATNKLSAVTHLNPGQELIRKEGKQKYIVIGEKTKPYGRFYMLEHIDKTHQICPSLETIKKEFRILSME